jgi:CRP-like cAMP-binding protein
MPIALQIPVSNGGFDPRAFLARQEVGKTIERYAKNQKIFSQGDVADTVFFIQKGKVKITVLSELHGIDRKRHFDGCEFSAPMTTASMLPA